MPGQRDRMTDQSDRSGAVVGCAQAHGAQVVDV